MKKANYGVDAPLVVFLYFAVGALCFILAIVQAHTISYFGILLLVIGGYMLYGSKCGKYKMREKILQRLVVRENDTVLDVGCGRGLMLNGAARKLKTGKAYGIDLWSGKDQSGNSRNATLKNAQLEGTADKIEVQNADMCALPFKDETFSVIVSSLAIHNVSGEDSRKKALLEIARVAGNGCRVAILDLAHVQEYADILSKNGFMVEEISKNKWQMFPPVRVLYARRQKIANLTSKK